jgi:hypothetical protein
MLGPSARTTEDAMNDKRSKMWGEPVSNEEVIAELGVPSAEWERNSRQIEFRKRLKRGQDDLDISGIRGYGRIDGYLAYLRRSLVRPLGVGTGLVSEEADECIWLMVTAEVEPEIAKYATRLAMLERSPEAVATHIEDMRRWLEYVGKLGPMDPESEELDELKEMAKRSNEEREREIAALRRDIDSYTALLASLRAET